MSAIAPSSESALASDASAAQYSHVNSNSSAELSTVVSRAARPPTAGPPEPEPPFPIVLCGAVQKGYGRGGKDLGCPTANLPDDALDPILGSEANPRTGVYYGFAQVLLPHWLSSLSSSASLESSSSPRPAASTTEEHGTTPSNTRYDIDSSVYPMVMSVGWNPFYKNDRLSAEVHIIHKYPHDFYRYEMRVLILGYIRPEYDYISREALIEDIETDIKVALRSLERPTYATCVHHEIFGHARRHEMAEANGQESKS